MSGEPKIDCNWIEKVLHRYVVKNINLPQQFALPRVTPQGWWESDIWTMTKAGYWHEYEIKTSRSDLKADAKKHRYIKRSRTDIVFKHDELFLKSEAGPNYFWFATPPDLVTLDEIPEWAGLVEIDWKPIYADQFIASNLKVIKKAPRLHKVKFSEKRFEQIKTSMMYRYMSLYFK